MSKSEMRIYQNRLRRQKELRRNIAFVTSCITQTLLTVCLTVVVSCTGDVFMSNAKAAADGCGYKYYKSIRIESGDTLWSIATKYKPAGGNTISLVEEIKRMNGLSNERITAGNYLIVPYYKNYMEYD